MTIKIIQTKLQEEEILIIKNASQMIGIPRSSFLRMVGLREARKIIQENKGGNQ